MRELLLKYSEHQTNSVSVFETKEKKIDKDIASTCKDNCGALSGHVKRGKAKKLPQNHCTFFSLAPCSYDLSFPQVLSLLPVSLSIASVGSSLHAELCTLP